MSPFQLSEVLFRIQLFRSRRDLTQASRRILAAGCLVAAMPFPRRKQPGVDPP